MNKILTVDESGLKILYTVEETQTPAEAEGKFELFFAPSPITLSIRSLVLVAIALSTDLPKF